MFIYNNITITALEEKDLEFCKELRNDPDTWKQLTDIVMLTSEGQKLWYNKLLSDPTRKYFIVHKDSRIEDTRVGLIRCDEIDYINHSIRVGADVVKECRGKGIGTHIYKLLLKYCFEYLNMHRIWLEVLETNTIAIKLYRNTGFFIEGKKREAIFREGKYIDCLIMSITKDEYERLSSHNN